MHIMYRALSIPFFIWGGLLALAQPGVNIYKFPSARILDVGIFEFVGRTYSWVLIVLVMLAGVWLWSLGNKNESKNVET
jgi:hypothetical protein